MNLRTLGFAIAKPIHRLLAKFGFTYIIRHNVWTKGPYELCLAEWNDGSLSVVLPDHTQLFYRRGIGTIYPQGSVVGFDYVDDDFLQTITDHLKMYAGNFSQNPEEGSV